MDSSGGSSSDDHALGFDAGKRVSKITFITLFAIGVAEVTIGLISNSVVLIADGIDSFGDSAITLIVLLGLLFATKPNKVDGSGNSSSDGAGAGRGADRFRYYKIESFAAFVAAIGMVSMGVVIIIRAVEALLDPVEIVHPEIALITLASAAIVSGYRALQMSKIAGKYNLLSLKAGARNSIKDSMASVIGFFSILVAVYLGFPQADPIGAIIIAAFIFSISYYILKDSSLVLLDVIKNPQMVEQVKALIERGHGVKVNSISLRPMGPFLHAEISVVLDGGMTIAEFKRLADGIKKSVRRSFPTIQRIAVIIES
ncbi:MAG: cation diffusion facilitator family transporter [Candidatus Nitrosocaldus sp.]|nr:cation diffusion facilitator family transporter [Candidatus Nitrosocaldus sp.]MDW7999570.1 cation diffusion facilitator family transporter [Candidatus Nitrosocaldus sp.]